MTTGELDAVIIFQAKITTRDNFSGEVHKNTYQYEFRRVKPDATVSKPQSSRRANVILTIPDENEYALRVYNAEGDCVDENFHVNGTHKTRTFGSKAGMMGYIMNRYAHDWELNQTWMTCLKFTIKEVLV